MSDSAFSKQYILDGSVEISPEAAASVTRRFIEHGAADLLPMLGLVDA